MVERTYQGEGVTHEEADDLQCPIDEHGNERPYLCVHRLRLEGRRIDHHRHC